MQNVVTLHSLHTGDYVGGGVALRMPYVQSRARGVGEHIQNVVLGLGKVVQVGVEGAVLFPVLNPFLFNFVKIGVSHKTTLKIFNIS